MATGADKIFITAKKPDIEPDRLRPLALASDLRHGRVEWSGHYLDNPWNEHGWVNLDDYPRLTAYLQPYRALLCERHTAKQRPQRWHKTIDRVPLARTDD